MFEPYAKCEMGSDMTAPPDSSALPMRLACVAFAHSSVIVRGVEPGRGDHGVGRRQRSTNKQTKQTSKELWRKKSASGDFSSFSAVNFQTDTAISYA